MKLFCIASMYCGLRRLTECKVVLPQVSKFGMTEGRRDQSLQNSDCR